MSVLNEFVYAPEIFTVHLNNIFKKQIFFLLQTDDNPSNVHVDLTNLIFPCLGL